MMEVSEKVKDASRRASMRLAGRDSDFLFDCWYIAGFAKEFARTPLARTILGRPLVFFRTEAGSPVVLSDRCIHRSFPLSSSQLDGDTIVCGYHGLRYDVGGRCIEAPALGKCPEGLGVKSYPLRVQGDLVWIWMGDSTPAEELPLKDWVTDPNWPSSPQYHRMQASYVSLHENLLDLTHLSFLHVNTFGTSDFASAPYETTIDETRGYFRLVRTVSPTRLPPVWGEPLGLMGRDAARIVTSEFFSPSTHVVTGEYYALDVDPASRPDTRIRTAHLATPETKGSTHYFILHARNYAIEDSAVTEFQDQQLTAAFLEDVAGLEAVERLVAQSAPEERYEVSLASDRAGVAMRRWLFKAINGQVDA